MKIFSALLLQALMKIKNKNKNNKSEVYGKKITGKVNNEGF